MFFFVLALTYNAFCVIYICYFFQMLALSPCGLALIDVVTGLLKIRGRKYWSQNEAETDINKADSLLLIHWIAAQFTVAVFVFTWLYLKNDLSSIHKKNFWGFISLNIFCSTHIFWLYIYSNSELYSWNSDSIHGSSAIYLYFIDVNQICIIT